MMTETSGRSGINGILRRLLQPRFRFETIEITQDPCACAGGHRLRAGPLLPTAVVRGAAAEDAPQRVRSSRRQAGARKTSVGAALRRRRRRRTDRTIDDFFYDLLPSRIHVAIG